ncbi:fumarylacetoacetate hydrolase family protein [Natronococcus wangiae]|uniref:fumarylacetoacetate hydrolase family protein n=1 Tax=Natronococcus wangiae TaxID=3068275 RepID=UPI00273EC217|nr:fumarylacetoacetate hydrolase family protein [Natronococcus sp. AD5]
MKLTEFEVQTPVGPVRRVGAVDDEELIDVTASYGAVLAERGERRPAEIAAITTPPEMLAFLRRGDRAFEAAREALEFAAETDTSVGPDGAQLRYCREEVVRLGPLPRPNSIRDFMVVEEHVRNSLEEPPDAWYEMPVYYKGNPDTVVRPGADVEWPAYTDRLDYELEIAAIVGKRGRDVPAERAEEYIAGYTIFNDFSARDIQLREMSAQLGPAKGKDFANGLGPVLVTPDEIDVENLAVSARINGEVWSDGSLGEMYHSFAEIVEHVSQAEPLHPGDVLGSGTVGNGCGLELDRWLEPGDEIELEAEGIGTLRHRVVDSASTGASGSE